MGSSSSTDNATADRSKISPSSKIMVVMSEDNSNHTAPPHPSVVGSNPAATAFSVRNWYDQHQVHQQANHHSYFSQVPAQYSNGRKTDQMIASNPHSFYPYLSTWHNSAFPSSVVGSNPAASSLTATINSQLTSSMFQPALTPTSGSSSPPASRNY